MTADTTLHLGGVTDLAQEPNALTKADLPVRIPPWPTRRDGLVWLWEDAGRPAALFDEKAGAVRELRAFRDQGTAGFDRYRRMRLAGGRMGTGFFSQTGEGMDFWRVVKANEFSLELTFQPAALTQGTPAGEGRFPVRLVNCSAWHDADWEFMLGQQGDKLLYSIRTVDNFLNMNGERVKGDLHGRAPAYEIATLADTRPHHLVVSYKPGTLVAFMDGRRVFATDQVTGNLAWGYGELCFGDNHNGGRHRWHGRIEGVALYHRFVAEAEAAANATVYLAKVNARVPLPSARIEGKLLAKTTVPEVKTIHPYHDALVVNEYEVVRVVETSPGWTLRPALLPAMTIRVAQWGILDDVKTGVDGTEIGGRVPLTLEVYTGHPDKLDEQVVADTLAEDLDAPLFYEPLP
ncbi:MAG: hypothetical protein BWZ02_00502 [Lentisphaerae bacterium ADurb.BinA184]|nr:MAG: hypothetical protein BWZ02_00502 [Lentisphaerae bacterium ADurb.BinA184]